jgi:hypothetical protein
VGLTNTILEVEGISNVEATYPSPVLSVGLFWIDSVGEIISTKDMWTLGQVGGSTPSPTWLGHLGQHISEVSHNLARRDPLNA